MYSAGIWAALVAVSVGVWADSVVIVVVIDDGVVVWGSELVTGVLFGAAMTFIWIHCVLTEL